MAWWRMELELPGELEESLLWRLESLGIVRVAVQFRPEQPARRTLVAWLPEIDWPETERQRLQAALADMAEPFQQTLPPLSWQRQPEEDWALSWKRHWQPDPVGQRLLILPAWLEQPPEHSQRLPLLIDPGSAFGTGSHPTTRLCIEGLEALAQRRGGLKGTLVADLGCGSGILGLAALALGADRVCAVDTDSLAVRATGDNAALNGATEGLQVAQGSAEALAEMLQGQRAGVLLCNILAPVLAELGPSFEGLLDSDGVGLLSGLLIDQVEPLVAVLEPLGWHCTLAAEQSRWALVRIQRQAIN